MIACWHDRDGDRRSPVAGKSAFLPLRVSSRDGDRTSSRSAISFIQDLEDLATARSKRPSKHAVGNGMEVICSLGKLSAGHIGSGFVIVFEMNTDRDLTLTRSLNPAGSSDTEQTRIPPRATRACQTGPSRSPLVDR